PRTSRAHSLDGFGAKACLQQTASTPRTRRNLSPMSPDTDVTHVPGPDRGSFHFDDMCPGKIELTLRPRADPWDFVLLDLQAGDRKVHDFVTRPGVTVTGEVRSATTGRPIAGAEIGEGSWYSHTAHTDEFGSYEWSGIPGNQGIDLSASAAGFSRLDQLCAP